MANTPRTFNARAIEPVPDRRASSTARGYGSDWKRIARLYRSAHPVCELCRVAPSDDVDHVLPFSSRQDPLRTSWDNLQALCRPCHVRKTHGG